MNLRNFNKLIASLNVEATVSRYKGTAYLRCWAAEGQRFVESGCPELTCFDYGGRKGYMDDLREEMAQMLECGLEDIDPDPTCFI